MDATTILREVSGWPAEEKMRLVETLWDQLLDSGFEPELTEAQKAELDRRIDAMEADPSRAIPLEEAKAYLRRPR
jgi:putative addiction module component (TIGR02574 family)